MSRAVLSPSALHHAPGQCALCGAPASRRLRRLSRAGLQVHAVACSTCEPDVDYALWATSVLDVARAVPAGNAAVAVGASSSSSASSRRGAAASAALSSSSASAGFFSHQLLHPHGAAAFAGLLVHAGLFVYVTGFLWIEDSE